MVRAGLGTLSVASAIGIYLLIVFGAVVRVTDSGLGCPDWPLCYGQLIPPLDSAAILEYGHRMFAAVVSAVIVATAAVAWTRHRANRLITIPMVAVLPLLLLQIGLGAITVILELPPMIVLVHLSTAMILLALVIIASLTAVYDQEPNSPVHRRTVDRATSNVGLRLVYWTGAALFVLLMSGAFVRASGATWICAGFPLCNGELMFGNRLIDIHMLHRFVAILVGSLLIFTVWRIASERNVPRRIVVAAVLVFLAVAFQIGVGIWAVSTQAPALLRGLHVAGSAGVWSAYVSFAVLVSQHAAASGEKASDLVPAEVSSDRAPA
jgi:heme A synthase